MAKGAVPALCMLLLALAACNDNDSEPPPGGRLGIESARSGEGEIWLIDVDGSNAEPVVKGVQPAWSPQGHFAYSAHTEDGSFDLFAVIDGVTQRLTTEPVEDVMSAWSPDGLWIAFASVDAEGNQDVYKISIESGEIIRLTSDLAVDFQPAWSPDGARIAFTSRRDLNFEIYVMNADGSDQTRLTVDDERDDEAAWSPDGQRIAFSSFRSDQAQIWLMHPDGSDPKELTSSEEPSFGPVWSPDGRRIAFSRVANATAELDRNTEVFIMGAGGSGETQVTAQSGPDTVYGWLPPSAP